MLSKEQIVELATVIKNDIAPYIAAHRAEYEAYLREIEKEDAYEAAGARPRAQDGCM